MNLDAIPRNSAPGHSKKLQDFAPPEQYKLLRVFMPKPTPEEHKAWILYCTVTGLTEEAKSHEQALNPTPPESAPPESSSAEEPQK
jgi:hypothetical protein